MSSTGSKRNRFSRRLEAVYRKGFEDGKEALTPAAKLEARRIKLGKRQLETLLSVGCTSAVIVPTPITKRLCKIGLMKSHGPNGSFASMTTSGLRALADAVDAGSAELFVMPTDKAALASGAKTAPDSARTSDDT